MSALGPESNDERHPEAGSNNQAGCSANANIDQLFDPPGNSVRSIEPGSFTKLFAEAPKTAPKWEENASAASPLTGPAAAGDRDSSENRAAKTEANVGEFTMLFENSMRKSASPAQVESPLGTTTSRPLPESPKASSFTDVFGAPAQPAAPEHSAVDDAGADEFGRAFSFPLLDRSHTKQESAAVPVAGEFTKLFTVMPKSAPEPTAAAPSFGSAHSTASPGIPAFSDSAPATAFNTGSPELTSAGSQPKGPGAFTKLFQLNDLPAAKASDPIFQKSFATPQKPLENDPPFFLTPLTPDASAVFPSAPPTRAVQPDGATGLFTSSSTPAMPAAAPGASPVTAPSAFTQIISGAQLRELQQKAAAAQSQPPASQPGLGVAGIQHPGMGSIVPTPTPMPMAMPQPVMPPQPQMPHVQMPPSPQMQGPQMQTPQWHIPPMQVPPTPAPAPLPPVQQPPLLGVKREVNWLPLSLGLNILLFLVIVILIALLTMKK